MLLLLANSPAQTPIFCHSRPRRLDAPAPLRLWHLASLDAPTVAVAWSLGFAWAAGIRLPVWVPVLLALSTWAVYIGDRLLDTRAALRYADLHSLRERHFFHWSHRRILAPLALIAASAAAAIIFDLIPAALRECDSALALAALAYFSGVHSFRRLAAWRSPFLTKEFLVGVLFTTGCALPVLFRLHLPNQSNSSLWLLLAVVSFFAAVAWLNCRAIDRWESLVTTSRIFISGTLLGISGLLLAVVSASIRPRVAALLTAGAVSALLLALIDRRRDRLTLLALRAVADLVLLTPLVLLAR